MSATYYCYNCKEAFSKIASKKCPKCDKQLVGKSNRQIGLTSLLFGTFFGFLALPAYKMDQTVFYICVTMFVFFLWQGMRKISQG